jgi:hypothetical protein
MFVVLRCFIADIRRESDAGIRKPRRRTLSEEAATTSKERVVNMSCIVASRRAPHDYM